MDGKVKALAAARNTGDDREVRIAAVGTFPENCAEVSAAPRRHGDKYLKVYVPTVFPDWFRRGHSSSQAPLTSMNQDLYTGMKPEIPPEKLGHDHLTPAPRQNPGQDLSRQGPQQQP
jgi:hypothetical protein